MKAISGAGAGSIAATPTLSPIAKDRTDAAPSPHLQAAASAEKTGGMVASHIVGLQKLASDKQVCIFVRAVNPESTSLIREGFGTKDMAIKGKSSKIPPLSALIPRDQAYGKKAFDRNLPAAERDRKVAELTACNEKAIKEHRATSVDLSLMANRIKDMTRAGLEIRGSWIDAQPGDPLPLRSGLMLSRAEGQEFMFWGEKEDDGSVSIFHATDEGGAPSKGDRVRVMGNREGKIVTADYDLALIAPRIEDYGAEHTRPLKMTSADEMVRRTGISMEAPAHDDRQWAADQALKVATAQSRGETSEQASHPAPMSPLATRKRVFNETLDIAEATTQERYAAIEGMDPPDGQSPLRDLGNISRFTKDLLPDLNRACGVSAGGEVFHHSDDAGNPFSVEADNYPMTVILPDNERLSGSEKIQIVRDGAELRSLFRTLKDGGFMPIGTDKWDDKTAAPQDRLTGVRSGDFATAQRVVARHLAGEVMSDHFDPSRPQRRAESRVENARTFVSQTEADAGAARRSASRDFHEQRITADQMKGRVQAAETMAEAARDELSIALMSKPI